MVVINALAQSHNYVKKTVKPGDIVIDTTVGKGRDTLFLAELVGGKGRVHAFDIQKKSIELTSELLESKGLSNTVLLHESHDRMDEFVKPGVSCVMFNLGYLPGTDHSVQTKGATTVSAIRKAMRLLKKNGIITLVIYQGGDTGFEERDSVIEFCSSINQKSFAVMKTSFINQANNPPIFICIEKL